MEHFERKISSETIYRGRIITLESDKAELENGAVALREVVRHSGGVGVLAIDGENNVLFVRQFRYPYGETLWELPAGKLEPGEDPAACGARELEEETGLRPGSMRLLAELYPSPGYLDERLYVYEAGKLAPAAQNLDENEFLTVIRVPYKQAIEMCQNGEIKDAKTICALMMHYVKKLEARG